MAERAPEPRTGMPPVELDEAEFLTRFKAQYSDPAFDAVAGQLDAVARTAWDGYSNSRKSPRTHKAGAGYADPNYDLADEWRATKEAIDQARHEYEDPAQPPCILIINGSSRSEHTCPGEMSKSWRLTEIAREICGVDGVKTEVLNLSRLAAEYGAKIHPCKACFSTAAALCHWPCSCYPNYALGQTQDLMNEIYPLWVRAHGIMLITPVNWYHTSSPMKLMIDRLVCADGGNPDPTTTHGKDAKKAKQLELDGWPYPRHLEGRLFGIVVHGDVEGAENVRRSLADWLRFMHLVPAGVPAELDRYIGYWEPYATSHDALDKDLAIQDEVRNAARTLLEAVQARRSGHLVSAGDKLESPRQK
ncbi:MAG: flavodoxin family protein [Sphingomicrobium sp.]